MSARGPVLLVARREFATRVMTKANVVSMLVMVVVIVGAGLAGKFFLGEPEAPPALRLAVSPSSSALAEYLEQPPVAGAGGVTVEELDEAAARAQLEDDLADPRLTAWITGEASAPVVLFEREADPEVLLLVEQAAKDALVAQIVSDLGGDPAEARSAVSAVTVGVDQVVAPDDELDPAQLAVAFIIISLLLGTLIGSGSMIAMGVVEEKTSRVVELLLSTIRPGQLLTGKILGIGAYGLFQMVVIGGALVVTVSTLGLFPELDVDLGATFALMLLWFLLGFGVFALLFGGFAALVSRQEDIGSVTTPLMFALFVPFYTTMFLVPEQPTSTLVKALSQIPLFAPFMMPTRAAAGALEPWEMPLALAVTGLTIPVLVWISARVYRRAVLHTGGRMKIGEALRTRSS